MKNASDRLTNNLNVLNKHAMLIEEKCDLYDNSTEYTFNISDYQLSQLNITEANEVFMHGAKPGDVFVRKSCKKIIDEICRQEEARTHSDDYKNKPHLRSNYMSDYDITKVEVLNDRVVIMRFGDGSFTKAICTEDDAKNGKFDVDIGITICLIKKVLGEETKKKAYEKLLKKIHKMMDEQDKQAREEEQRKANAKARKLRKAQRRAAAVKQENDMFRNDISDAVLYALERLEVRKTESEPEKVG